MKVVLPDNSELELPDGATGLDAARAIGPKLAEQAVLIRANGAVQDLRLPLHDGQPIQILTTRDKDDPDALYVLRHSSAHLLAEAVRRLYPGVKIAIGPPIENGFYYDFEFPEPIHEEDLETIEAEVARGDLARRGEGALRCGGRAVQGRASRHRGRRHLAVHAG
jgi:threonyl-tRNA synthetase